MEIIENNKFKKLVSPDYNYIFDKKSGLFIRWGSTLKQDPEYSLYGPEIADIEISETCHQGCKFCYKANTPKGRNMTLDELKLILSKFPKTLTQIAYGIGDIDGNPYLWDILKYTRDQGIIPNITINGNISLQDAKKLVNLVGAVAVSHYNENLCFNTIQMLTNLGLKQCNMHYMLCNETVAQAFDLIHTIAIKADKRLQNLNAIVFLSLKNKGRAKNSYTPISQHVFSALVDTCLDLKINFGFDSCSAIKFLNSIKGRDDQAELIQMVEPCESTKFSSYVNVAGEFYPCSFIEGEKDCGWDNGLVINESTNFLKDIWFHEKTVAFRQNAIICTNCNKSCSYFEI